MRGVRQFVAFLEARGMPATAAGLAREHVEAWITGLLVPEVPIPVLDDEALRNLLRSCADKSSVDRREQAILSRTPTGRGCG